MKKTQFKQNHGMRYVMTKMAQILTFTDLLDIMASLNYLQTQKKSIEMKWMHNNKNTRIFINKSIMSNYLYIGNNGKYPFNYLFLLKFFI